MSRNEEQIANEAILNFLGSTYGELKKLDGNVVGPSSTLGHRSGEVKNELEKFINEKRKQPIQVNNPQPVPQPVQHENNLPEVQQPQVQVNQPVQPVQMPVDNDQLTFNFNVNEKEELFTLIDKVLTRLDKLHRKVDEISIIHSDFIKTYHEAKSLTVKKKSTTRKKVLKKKET